MGRQTSGLIIEVKADAVVVMTREGIFLELPKDRLAGPYGPGLSVPVTLGEEWFGTSGQEPAPAPDRPEALRWSLGLRARRWLQSRPRLQPRRVRALALAASLLLSVAGGLGAYQALAAPAYEVAIEINPSIILEVNARDVVIGARPGNDDGAAVLEQVDLRGLSVLEAVRTVVAAAHQLGYLAQGTTADPALAGAVLVSVIPHRSDAAVDVPSLTRALQEAAADTGSDFSAVIQVVPPEQVEQLSHTAEQGTSVARAVLAEKLREDGLELSDREVAEASVTELARLLKEHGSKHAVEIVELRHDDRDDDDDDDDDGDQRGKGRRRGGGPERGRGGERSDDDDEREDGDDRGRRRGGGDRGQDGRDDDPDGRGRGRGHAGRDEDRDEDDDRGGGDGDARGPDRGREREGDDDGNGDADGQDDDPGPWPDDDGDESGRDRDDEDDDDDGEDD